MKSILTRLMAIIALGFLLTGCVTTPVEKIVYQTKYVVIAPEAKYFEASPVKAPPPISKYGPEELVDWEKEYKALAESTIAVYGSIGSCNADKHKALIDLQEKKRKYERSN